MITVEISSKTNTMNEDLEQAERKDCVLTRLPLVNNCKFPSYSFFSHLHTEGHLGGKAS